jgi:hypothetical protein
MSFGKVVDVIAATPVKQSPIPVIKNSSVTDVGPSLEMDVKSSADASAKSRTSQHNDKFTMAMKTKYGGNNLCDSISNMLRFAREVRQGPLYQQVAKFVGRVEIGGTYTGTGTLVNWNEMPENLVGKIVLTVAHNHPSWTNTANSDYQKYVSLYADLIKTVAGTSSGIYVSNHIKGGNPLSNYMWFTPDVDADHLNVWGNSCNSSSIPVEKCYLFKSYVKEKEGNLFEDFAILVLKRKIMALNGANLGSLENMQAIPTNKTCFTIGYGTLPSPSPLNFHAGWNLKKRTQPSIWSDGFTPDDYARFYGPSDSGSPIIYKNGNNYSIVGVYGGGQDYPLATQIDRMKAVINIEKGNKPLKPVMSNR